MAPSPSWSVFENRRPQCEPFRDLGDVGDVEGDELAAAQRPGVPDDEQRSVPDADEPVEVQGADHGPYLVGAGRRPAARSDAVGPEDALQRLPDERGSGRCVESGVLVRLADRGESTAQRRCLPVPGEVGEVEGDGLWRSRQWCEAVGDAPGGEVGPVGPVRPGGVVRPGVLDEGLDGLNEALKTG